jgi:hypothetical protein
MFLYPAGKDQVPRGQRHLLILLSCNYNYSAPTMSCVKGTLILVLLSLSLQGHGDVIIHFYKWKVKSEPMSTSLQAENVEFPNLTPPPLSWALLCIQLIWVKEGSGHRLGDQLDSPVNQWLEKVSWDTWAGLLTFLKFRSHATSVDSCPGAMPRHGLSPVLVLFFSLEIPFKNTCLRPALW